MQLSEEITEQIENIDTEEIEKQPGEENSAEVEMITVYNISLNFLINKENLVYYFDIVNGTNFANKDDVINIEWIEPWVKEIINSGDQQWLEKTNKLMKRLLDGVEKDQSFNIQSYVHKSDLKVLKNAEAEVDRLNQRFVHIKNFKKAAAAVTFTGEIIYPFSVWNKVEVILTSEEKQVTKKKGKQAENNPESVEISDSTSDLENNSIQEPVEEKKVLGQLTLF